MPITCLKPSLSRVLCLSSVLSPVFFLNGEKLAWPGGWGVGASPQLTACLLSVFIILLGKAIFGFSIYVLKTHYAFAPRFLVFHKNPRWGAKHGKHVAHCCVALQSFLMHHLSTALAALKPRWLAIVPSRAAWPAFQMSFPTPALVLFLLPFSFSIFHLPCLSGTHRSSPPPDALIFSTLQQLFSAQALSAPPAHPFQPSI